MNENELANRIIGHAIEGHKSLGPGLLENTYKECLFYLIKEDGFFVEKEKEMPITFREIKVGNAYRIDLLVENKVLIEMKSVDGLNDLHPSQTLTYLKMGKYK